MDMWSMPYNNQNEEKDFPMTKKNTQRTKQKKWAHEKSHKNAAIINDPIK